MVVGNRKRHYAALVITRISLYSPYCNIYYHNDLAGRLLMGRIALGGSSFMRFLHKTHNTSFMLAYLGLAAERLSGNCFSPIPFGPHPTMLFQSAISISPLPYKFIRLYWAGRLLWGALSLGCEAAKPSSRGLVVVISSPNQLFSLPARHSLLNGVVN
jgi:hypothetical protein